MLIAIGALVVVVLFLASKTTPANSDTGTVGGSSLPNPGSIPATGTSGVPSPATSIGYFAPLGNPLLGTARGQVIGDTNASLPAQSWKGNPPLPPTNTVSSAPTSTPLLAKQLVTGARAILPLTQFNAGQNLRKL